MKYERFEQLPVWITSAKLAAQIFPWCSQPLFRGKGDLGNQLQRATLSISNNIAEGFERGSTNELLNFLYIARGSAGEVRSMLCVMNLMNDFDALCHDITDFKKTCESISRQLGGWTQQLQNSDIKGPRHLNNQSKKRYERKKQRTNWEIEQQKWRSEFEEKLKSEARARNQPD